MAVALSINPCRLLEVKTPLLIYNSQWTQQPLKRCKFELFVEREVREPSDRPPTLSPSNNTLCGCGSQIRGELSFGEGHRPFYHLLKTPFGAISHVAQLDAAHPCGAQLLDSVCLPQTNEKWLLLNEKVTKKLVKYDYQILSNNPCLLKVTLGSVLYLY